jgi:hypothetical protein
MTMTRSGTLGLTGLGLMMALLAATSRPLPVVAQQIEKSGPVPAPVLLPPFFQAAVERGTRSLDGSPGESHWTNWSTYEIDARLDPTSSRLEGSATIRYENRSPVSLRFVTLYLYQNLHAEGVVRNSPQEITGGVELTRVTAMGEDLQEGDLRMGPSYAVEGTVMSLRPPSDLEVGDTLTLEIDWAVTLPQNGSGRMGNSQGEVFFVAYWFPKMAVFDDVRGWDAEPYMSGSEFYDDFGDYRVSLSVPGGWTVMATGDLENPEEVYTETTLERLAEASVADTRVEIASTEDVGAGRVTVGQAGGWQTYRFQADSVRDFAWTTSNVQRWDATSAVVPDRDDDGVEDRVLIHSFWREDRAPLWEDQWLYGKQAIEHHSRYTGFAYPWPHMTSVEGADIIGGGMEFPMLTLIGPYDDRSPQDLFNVTSHELAHMWVPMTVGSNEKRYAWMDEGSTTFLEDQSRMEYWPGVDHHRIEAGTYLRTAAAGLEQPLMRHGDWYEPGPGYGIASYSKPATLMVALRALIGQDAWEEAYRTFISEWAFKHPTPWDFFNTFERFAGEDLDWFWTSYYFETWTLDFEVTSVQPEVGGGASIRVENRGLAPFPVVVRIHTTGEGVIERSVEVEHWLGGRRSVVLDIPASAGSVTRVEVDPSGYAPDADRSNNFWPQSS